MSRRVALRALTGVLAVATVAGCSISRSPSATHVSTTPAPTTVAASSGTAASTATRSSAAIRAGSPTPLLTVTNDPGEIGPVRESRPIALQPDAHTLYLGSGSLPDPISAELTVPFPLRLRAHVSCTGKGTLLVVTDAGAGRTATFLCPTQEDEAALGRAQPGTVSFRMVGDPGIDYVLRVQANRKLP